LTRAPVHGNERYERKLIITDNSSQSSTGLAALRLYRDKLTPLVQIDLKVQGGQQVLVVTGPRDTFVSNSFGWGRPDERTEALQQATSVLGWAVPLEVFQQIPPSQERLIRAQPPRLKAADQRGSESSGLPLPPSPLHPHPHLPPPQL